MGSKGKTSNCNTDRIIMASSKGLQTTCKGNISIICLSKPITAAPSAQYYSSSRTCQELIYKLRIEKHGQELMFFP
jgi:hypothetical protein